MAELFTISRRLEIDAAHRVPDHGSKCYAIHGHRYVIEAIAQGPLAPTGEQKGMVMDFGFLKEIMVEVIHDQCDHGLILWEGDKEVLERLDPPPHIAHLPRWLKLVTMRDVPTAENLARYWFNGLEVALCGWMYRHDHLTSMGNSVYLKELRVHETPNCVAVYSPDSSLYIAARLAMVRKYLGEVV
jgi:6-pyruvoyltetrahydropterin/6-carboxytetrahydropterin synthase